jgi:hypothetical protein
MESIAEEPAKPDGVFKVRVVGNGEKILRIRQTMAGEYRRYVNEDETMILFEKV